MELALLCLHKQLIHQKALKNLSEAEHVFLRRAGEDEDFINVDEKPVEHVMENIIYPSLELSRGFGEVKMHDTRSGTTRYS